MKRKSEAREEGGANACVKKTRLVHTPRLPPEIWEHVFSFLHPRKDRRRISLVCREWNRLSWNVLDSLFNYKGVAFSEACAARCTEAINRLIEGGCVDLCVEGGQALTSACAFGHAEVVHQLLAYDCVDPTFADNAPIYLAAKWGHMDIVKILLACPAVDPATRNNHVLRTALVNHHYDIANELIADPRVVPFT